jgi:hypothetical protein
MAEKTFTVRQVQQALDYANHGIVERDNNVRRIRQPSRPRNSAPDSGGAPRGPGKRSYGAPINPPALKK